MVLEPVFYSFEILNSIYFSRNSNAPLSYSVGLPFISIHFFKPYDPKFFDIKSIPIPKITARIKKVIIPKK